MESHYRPAQTFGIHKGKKLVIRNNLQTFQGISRTKLRWVKYFKMFKMPKNNFMPAITSLLDVLFVKLMRQKFKVGSWTMWKWIMTVIRLWRALSEGLRLPHAITFVFITTNASVLKFKWEIITFMMCTFYLVFNIIFDKISNAIVSNLHTFSAHRYFFHTSNRLCH